MLSFKIHTVKFAFSLLLANAAEASCLNPNADTRLRTYCVASTLVGKAITINDAVLVDTLLKREGFSTGIGMSNRVRKGSTQTFVSPVLDYNSNINGGNPNRPIVLGNLTFTGDEKFLRKKGAVTGVKVATTGRSIINEGKYLDYSIAASYAYSPRHDLGIARISANVCSRNHISKQWYFDACGDTARLVRDLITETNSGLSLITTKLFSTGNGAYHSTNVAIRKHHSDDYKQDQIQLGWTTVRNGGAYTSLKLSFGEPVLNQLALRRSITAKVGTTLFGRALGATLSYSHSDGGRLLGIGRHDITRSFSLSYALNANLSVTLGYRDVDSSIDYFSEHEPVVSIQFAPIRF